MNLPWYDKATRPSDDLALEDLIEDLIVIWIPSSIWIWLGNWLGQTMIRWIKILRIWFGFFPTSAQDCYWIWKPWKITKESHWTLNYEPRIRGAQGDDCDGGTDARARRRCRPGDHFSGAGGLRRFRPQQTCGGGAGGGSSARYAFSIPSIYNYNKQGKKSPNLTTETHPLVPVRYPWQTLGKH